VARITRIGKGSWTEGRALALGLPVADPTYRRLLPSRRPHDPDLMLAALRLFDADLPADEARSWTRYGEWAAGYSKTALENGLRIPRSGLTMSRAFGSWQAALDAAGIEVPGVARSRVAKRWTSRDGAVRALRRAAEELDLPLTENKYNNWVFALRRAAVFDGRVDQDALPAPSASAIARRFGGWRRAVKECLGPETPVARGRTDEYSEAELASMWDGFMGHAGERYTEANWTTYRQLTRREDGSYLVPTAVTLARCLGGGSWTAVCRYFNVRPSGPPRRYRAWSDDDLIASWRACKRDLGAAPTCERHYMLWRERRRAETSAVPPSTLALIRRLGRNGSWSQLYARLEGHAPPDAPGTAKRYSDQEIAAAWRGAEAAAGGIPSMTEYDQYRIERSTGEHLVPSVNTMVRRFGSWGEAQRQLSGAQLRPRQVRRTDAELHEFVRRFISTSPAWCSMEGYNAWRASEMKRTGERIPTVNTIVRRIGRRSWTEAVNRAVSNPSGDGLSAE
jgi:hypothetical protein